MFIAALNHREWGILKSPAPIAALHEHEVSAFVGDQAGDGGNAGLADSRARDYCAGRSLADHLAATEARFVGL